MAEIAHTSASGRTYHTAKERLRESDLVRLFRSAPRGKLALDVGARDGYYSGLLTECFDSVVALDLERPPIAAPGIVPVAGDVTALEYPNDTFDFVLCSEVLEHVGPLESAGREIRRVTAPGGMVLIGVPYKQDLRVGRLTCGVCGRISSPWGHVNSFDERRLLQLFSGMETLEISRVGENSGSTTSLAAKLMDWGGNPWGAYDQQERCSCGAVFQRPEHRSVVQKLCTSLAGRMNRLQAALTKRHADWLHVLLRKPK